MIIYDPISIALGIEPIELIEDPNDHTHIKNIGANKPGYKINDTSNMQWNDRRKENKRQENLLKISNDNMKIPSTKGYKHSQDTIKKMKERVPHNKGKKGIQVAWNKGLKKQDPNAPKITKINSQCD